MQIIKTTISQVVSFPYKNHISTITSKFMSEIINVYSRPKVDGKSGDHECRLIFEAVFEMDFKIIVHIELNIFFIVF